MSVWIFGDILSRAKEWALVAIGAKALTAHEEERIRREAADAIRRAGGTESDVQQAMGEITWTIEQGHKEMFNVGSAVKSAAPNVIGILVIVAIAAVFVGAFGRGLALRQ